MSNSRATRPKSNTERRPGACPLASSRRTGGHRLRDRERRPERSHLRARPQNVPNFQRRRRRRPPPEPSHRAISSCSSRADPCRKIYVPGLQVPACLSQGSQIEQYAPERFTFWHPHASPPLWLCELFVFPPPDWPPPEALARFRSAALVAACASRDCSKFWFSFTSSAL